MNCNLNVSLYKMQQREFASDHFATIWAKICTSFWTDARQAISAKTPSFSRYNQVFNFCRPPSTPSLRSLRMRTVHNRFLRAQFKCELLSSMQQELSIKLAQCCVKTSYYGSIWLSGSMLAQYYDSMLCIRHHNYMAQYAASCINNYNNYGSMLCIQGSCNAIKHQYVAQCCVSGINIAVHHANGSMLCIMHQHAGLSHNCDAWCTVLSHIDACCKLLRPYWCMMHSIEPFNAWCPAILMPDTQQWATHINMAQLMLCIRSSIICIWHHYGFILCIRHHYGTIMAQCCAGINLCCASGTQ